MGGTRSPVAVGCHLRPAAAGKADRTISRRARRLEGQQPPGLLASGALACGGQAARRRTSQTVMAMSSTDSATSQPPSIHWKGQYRLPGW